MPNQQFEQACDRVRNTETQLKSIGTLGERTLHAVLKYYFEPDDTRHETKVGSFVADIALDDGIIEIQTRRFDKLRKKLALFLQLTAVTVVYPVARIKWLVWIDEHTGEITTRRKSPKTGRIYDIFAELYRIKPLLCNERLRFCIVLLDMEEYRRLNGWSENKKRGSTRYERIPLDVCELFYINGIQDYGKLIPETLVCPFTTKGFSNASGLTLAASQKALNVLYFVGVVTRVGKQGNSYLYEKALPAEP